MNTFYTYVPVAKGKPYVDKIEIFVGLIGFGKDNAVKRADLVKKCIEIGLISESVQDPDRAMRRLLEKAKRDYAILNNCRGNGYYRPTPAERKELSKCKKREDGRAIKIFAGNKIVSALEEDYKHGRVEG